MAFCLSMSFNGNRTTSAMLKVLWLLHHSCSPVWDGLKKQKQDQSMKSSNYDPVCNQKDQKKNGNNDKGTQQTYQIHYKGKQMLDME